MYLKDVVTILRRDLPKSSSKFNESVSIDSATYAGGTVTIVTASAHGLEDDDVVSIVDCFQKTPITSITFADGVATVVTTIAHNLTLDYDSSEDQPKVVISGCTVSDYNGEWSLLDVADRNTFSFSISGSPADASDGSLLENIEGGFTGIKEVTVTDTTTFTFTTSKSLASEGQGGTVNHTFRIARTSNIERFLEAYSRQLNNKWWAVVAPGDVESSKNRFIQSDSTDIPTSGDDFRQKIFTTFTIHFVVPSTGDIAGGASYDECILESAALFKSMMGVALESPYTIGSFSKVVFSSHNFNQFLKAYYIHDFNFQITDELISDDFNEYSEDVAFRDIDIATLNENDETIMDTAIKLDT